MMYPQQNNEPEDILEEWYVRLFIAFSQRCETYIRATIAVLMGLLLAAQLLLQFPSVRHYLSHMDRLEGEIMEQK